MNFDSLIHIISDTHSVLQLQALKSMNINLTMRNWLYGLYIVEFEQNGEDRAAYGEHLLETLSDKVASINGLSYRNLKLFRQFYLAYPQIGQTVSAQFRLKTSKTDIYQIHQTLSDESDLDISNSTISENLNILDISVIKKTNKLEPIMQTASAQFNWNELKQNFPQQKTSFEIIDQLIIKQLNQILQTVSEESVPPAMLLQRLSFSHFVELMKIDEHWKRTFYEIECIKGVWNVRELKRQINSLLYERTGLSTNKKKALAQFLKNTETYTAQDVVRDPYFFEFAGLKPKEVFTERRLEDALLEHIQEFLLEMGKGFLFESRQKRIQIGDEYFYVDLVLYHRFLRCHVLIELKNREFRYADISQLNVYLNYFKQYETTGDENPPIGILLCTNKNDALVEFATAGIDNQLFISKYKLALPSIQELQQVIQDELKHLSNP